MNVVNAYTEDYTKAYSSSFMHEPVGGWRLPKSGQIKLSQEQYLNTIKNIKNRDLKNNSDYALYKSANTDVIGLIIEKISGIPLRDWVLSTVGQQDLKMVFILPQIDMECHGYQVEDA